jgi:hypothetical protein
MRGGITVVGLFIWEICGIFVCLERQERDEKALFDEFAV